MSAPYFAVAGHVVTDAAGQRVRVRPVVLQLGERLAPLGRIHHLVAVGRRRSPAVRLLHADETRLLKPATNTSKA